MADITFYILSKGVAWRKWGHGKVVRLESVNEISVDAFLPDAPSALRAPTPPGEEWLLGRRHHSPLLRDQPVMLGNPVEVAVEHRVFIELGEVEIDLGDG